MARSAITTWKVATIRPPALSAWSGAAHQPGLQADRHAAEGKAPGGDGDSRRDR